MLRGWDVWSWERWTEDLAGNETNRRHVPGRVCGTGEVKVLV